MKKKKGKWIIITDLEGIIGVNSFTDVENNRRLLTEELGLILKAISQYHPLSVTVFDIHNKGHNIEDISASEYGYEIKVVDGIQNIAETDEKYDFAILLGFHSMEGGKGRFPHSFRFDINEIRYGNRILGEVGIFCRWCRNRGAEICIVSGEGDFSGEVLPGCLIHLIETSDWEYERKELVSKIGDIPFGTKYEEFFDDKIAISFKNSDYIEKLRETVFAKYISNSEMLFPSIEEFLVELSALCTVLNRINVEIIKRNCNEIKKIAGKIKDRYAKSETDVLLKKQMDFVSQDDLEAMWRLLIDNESMDRN